jgi:hypothetical protein
MAENRTLVHPPRVPRWHDLERNEYGLLSNVGYPMPVRGKGLAQIPTDSSGYKYQPTSTTEILQNTDVFCNPLAQSSKGMMVREFNYPFPRLKHRFSDGRLSKGSYAKTRSSLSSTSSFAVRTTVPGVLWPALNVDPHPSSQSSTLAPPGTTGRNRPARKLDASRQFQDMRPSSALALSNSSHGLLSASLFSSPDTRWFIAINSSKVNNHAPTWRSKSVPLTQNPNDDARFHSVDTTTQSPNRFPPEQQRPPFHAPMPQQHAMPGPSAEPPWNSELEASATVQRQPPYVRSRAWVSASKFTGRRWDELR